jgi:hypothetical protein
MTLTNYAVKKFVSDKIQAVTACNITDLYEEFPSAKELITGFARMSIFGNHHGLVPGDEGRPFLLLIMRRTETAFSEYALAREELQRFISGNEKWSVYYRALYHLEATLSQLYQICDHVQKAQQKKSQIDKFFTKNDDSPLDRLNKIYNASKHQAADKDQPVWLTNEGIEANIDIKKLLKLKK